MLQHQRRELAVAAQTSSTKGLMRPWYHVVMFARKVGDMPTRGIVQLMWRCEEHHLACKQRDYFLAPRCPKCEEAAQ